MPQYFEIRERGSQQGIFLFPCKIIITLVTDHVRYCAASNLGADFNSFNTRTCITHGFKALMELEMKIYKKTCHSYYYRNGNFCYWEDVTFCIM